MEIIAGEQQLPNPDGFPQHIAPFPEPTDLVYDHPTAVIHSPDIINHRPISPPQKLRPIRSNAGLAGTLESGFLSSQAGCYDGELDCAVKVEGLASGNAYVAANDSVVVGSDHFVVGWERNGVERGLENESRKLTQAQNPPSPLLSVVKPEPLSLNPSPSPSSAPSPTHRTQNPARARARALPTPIELKTQPFLPSFTVTEPPLPPPLSPTNTSTIPHQTGSKPRSPQNELKAPAPDVTSPRFFSVLSSSSDDGVESVEYLAEDLRGPVNRKRRRRSRRNSVEHFLQSLVMGVMEKQEEMHKQLIEMIERMEKERVLREEAWKQLEIERHKRDEAVRAEEISRSLALISFLQNLLGEAEIQIPEPGARQNVEENGVETNSQLDKKCNPNNKTRWPEAEVQALIALRTALDHKFRVSGAKGSIWEEISAGMQMMGYNRTEKKCKEKWENINKYFKRLTESGKQQLPNGKSCQYLHNLDLLYRNGLVNPGVGVSITNVDGEDEKSERDSESL